MGDGKDFIREVLSRGDYVLLVRSDLATGKAGTDLFSPMGYIENVKKFEKLEKAYENGEIKNVRGDFLPKNTNFPKEIISYKFGENKLYIRRQA